MLPLIIKKKYKFEDSHVQFELDYFFCIYDFIQIIHKKVSDGQFTFLFNYMMYSQNIKEIS